MKVLVAYDGSESSDKAIDDLQRAGLPKKDVEALVVSVAEVWMPPSVSLNGDGFHEEDYPDFINELSKKRLKVARGAVHESETMSRHARERILAKFPNWKVSNKFPNGSPGWEILACADEFLPDLIVMGSQGRNALGRVLLGSISQKVLTEAKCSVRVARGKVEVDTFPLRIMIAFDGSNGSKIAVKEVCSRNWDSNTEVLLVSAIHSLVPATIGRFISPIKEWKEEDFVSESAWIEKMAESSIRKLEGCGYKVDLKVIEGNPKDVIVEQANDWQADSIFVGAHSYSGTLERFLIGSTSAAVAERANCSVEAVRQKLDF